MRSKKKLVLILSCLAATAAFSTASISTEYYKSKHTSTLSCQPASNDEHASDGLRYAKSGLTNVGKHKTVTVRCPVNLDGETEGSSYTYDIHLIAKGTANKDARTLKCALTEVASANRSKKQIQVRSADITGTSVKSLSWLGVEKLAVNGESAFTLECKLPPKVGLANITVKRMG
jgi:hypothetical protein